MPSAASAALCIAGERLCATGQPSTPRRLHHFFLHAGGCPPFFFTAASYAAAFFFEFGVGLGEDLLAAAVGAGDVVEVVHVRRVRGGVDRGFARV